MSDNHLSIRALRFNDYGEPGDVLQLDNIPAPDPAAARIRIVVHACGLNPADWALCRGLFKSPLPRGVGLEVSGIVDAVGEGVTDVAVGDSVFGAADYAGPSSAGAADRSILYHWAKMPTGLDFLAAAALPMATETAYRSLENLTIKAGDSLMVNGAGTTVGFAAVQIALMRGASVVASSGAANAERLRALGAKVTPYGECIVERVKEIAERPIDYVFDTAPPCGVLPDLIRIANGDRKRVLTVSDLAGSTELGVRNGFGEGRGLRYEVLGEFAKHAALGRYSIPIARTFPLEDWREALALSQSGNPRGKLILLPAPPNDTRAIS